MIEKKLSRGIRAKALISPAGEHAWAKKHIKKALNEFEENRLAIFGIDVWAIDTFQKENTVESLKDIFMTVKDVHLNDIPLEGGGKGRFNWNTGPGSDEPWGDFVKRATRESYEAIEKMGVEKKARQGLKENIYYHPIFMSEEEYESLIN